jgi:hypothetical protein
MPRYAAARNSWLMQQSVLVQAASLSLLHTTACLFKSGNEAFKMLKLLQ